MSETEQPSESDGRPGPTRRELLRRVLGGAFVMALPHFARGTGWPPAQGKPVKVGPVKQLPPGSARIVQWEDQPVIVLNVGGKIEALSAVCTHQSCTVEWDADDGVIQCPCHGSQFDTSGKVIRGPAPAPLFAVEVQVKDGEIYLPTDP